MTDSAPGLGLDLAATDAANNSGSASAEGYVVLARKYRPKDFSTLIGQDALVKTLTNAFSQNRLAHAFLLTGVRGVGKTTSARILAKAFNCIGPDGTRNQPTPEPCGVCANCTAITEDRHVDVLEIDAASNNGVDYIRQLQEELHYKPVQARYRVYIVDEVHMLSNSAFNAFLKTLEEPPGHVKFIFATTEANKLPITIRSRCQRFDLRRVSAEQLKDYYGRLSAMENVNVDDEALALIAQAADGSVRDGLSMLDQAIALASQESGGNVSAEAVRNMLGLNDGARLNQLFALVHNGESTQALALFDALFADGADPSILARELAQLTHLITRRKLVGDSVSALKSKAEAAFLAEMASGLSLGALNRTWELLIKGLDELRHTSHPQVSFDMLLVKLCHVAQMPDPDALLRQLNASNTGNGGEGGSQGNGGSGNKPQSDGDQSTSYRQSMSAESAQQPPTWNSQSDTNPNQTSQQAAPAPPKPMATRQVAPVNIAPPSQFDPADLDSNFMIDDRVAPGVSVSAQMPSHTETHPMPTSFLELVTLIENAGGGLLAAHLTEDVRPVSVLGNVIRLRLTDRAPRDIARTLTARLLQLTGQSWDVGLSDEDGDLPLGEQRRLARADEYREVQQHPSVAAALATFPEAKIHDIRQKQPSDEANIAGGNATIH